MEQLKIILDKIASLKKNDLEKYVLIYIGGLLVIIGGILYYTYSTASQLRFELKKIEKQANEAADVIISIKKIEIEEKRLLALLERNKNFNIKSFFEQFCRENGLSLPPNWTTNTVTFPNNDKIDEITLSALFQKQTTNKLTEILNKLEKKEIVYIKDLEITKNKKYIDFKLTIATKRYKNY